MKERKASAEQENDWEAGVGLMSNGH